MACSCRNKKADAVDIPHTTAPTESCVFCAEKHFGTALALAEECGYEYVNRKKTEEEAVLAQHYCYLVDYALAKLIRDWRHHQNGETLQKIADRFESLCGSGNYPELIRLRIIGQLCCSQWHVYQIDRELAEDIRNVRHLISNRREKEISEEIWRKIAFRFDAIIVKKLNN